MIIELKKFGNLLTSRQSGKEALSAIFRQLPINNIEVIIDFSGITTFSPGWGDEFLSPLQKKYQNNLFLKDTNNPSVRITLETLEETNKMKFQITK